VIWNVKETNAESYFKNKIKRGNGTAICRNELRKFLYRKSASILPVQEKNWLSVFSANCCSRNLSHRVKQKIIFIFFGTWEFVHKIRNAIFQDFQ
jgi:hypothetical protein